MPKSIKPKLTAVEGYKLSEAQRNLSAVREAISRQTLSAEGRIVLGQAEDILAYVDQLRYNCDIKPA